MKTTVARTGSGGEEQDQQWLLLRSKSHGILPLQDGISS